MPEGYFIHNALIVNEGKQFSGSVLIQDSLFKEVFAGLPPADFILPPGIISVDAHNRYLFPGVIDAHVHFREPGLTHKADISTESRAAVAGGVTSYFEMPNTVPNATTLDILEEKFEIARNRSLANYSFFLGATNDNIGEIEKADPARICGLKVFMGASTGNMLVDNERTLELIFSRSPLIIAVHAEEESIIRHNLENYLGQYGAQIPVSAHPLIRSEEACFTSSEKAVNLAHKFNTRLHLTHVSTARELDLLHNDQPLKDKKITGEVTLHHLWFDNRDYSDLGSRIRWNPAIKTSHDREALLQGLLDDRLDLIATDHAPHLRHEKEHQYTSCPSGGPMIQHALVAMLGFQQSGKITLEKIVEKMCHAPAVRYRIHKRGFIRQNYYADCVLVDPDDPWTVSQENILYKCGWSPLEGVTFKSRITHTWVNGALVFNEGTFNTDQNGKRISFDY